MRLSATPRLSKLYDTSAILKEIRAAVNETKQPILKDYQSTVKFFKKKPSFQARLSYRGGDFILTVFPTGSREAVKIWKILNNGARRRYAVMSPDYKPGTIPNTIRTRKSKGRVVFVSRKIKGKRIEARNWTTVIMKRNAPGFRGAVKRAVREALKKRK